MYTSAFAASGDGGGALLLEDGKVVGMHVGEVNSIKEGDMMKLDINERLNEAENVTERAIKCASRGSLALLTQAFPRV